eukprot:2157858-Pleurochrysis_carterae.AAC.3
MHRLTAVVRSSMRHAAVRVQRQHRELSVNLDYETPIVNSQTQPTTMTPRCAVIRAHQKRNCLLHRQAGMKIHRTVYL